MSLQERPPRRALASLEGGLDSVVLENVGDGPAGDPMAQMGESFSNPRVAPGGIVSCHSDDKVGDLRLRPRTAGFSPRRVVPLASDKLSVPGEDRVRGDDRRDHLEHAATKSLALHGETTAFVVGEAKSLSLELALQDSVLLDQVVDDVLLMAIEPAGEGYDEELPGVKRAHAGRR
jgi:hypothetical protein